MPGRRPGGRRLVLVVHLSKSTQSSGSLKVLVVRTLDWDTAGIRDLRNREPADGYSATDCVIGRELAYPMFNDKAEEAFRAARAHGPGGQVGVVPLRRRVRRRRDVGGTDHGPEYGGQPHPAGPCAGDP